MQSRQLEIHVHGLSYLVTIVIQRLHESDPAWPRKLLEDIRSDRLGASQYGSQAELADTIFRKALQLVENATAPEPSVPPPVSPAAGTSNGR